MQKVRKKMALLLAALFVLAAGIPQVFAVDLQAALDSVVLTFAAGDTADSITKDFTLPAEVDGLPIIWTSSVPDILYVHGDSAIVGSSITDLPVTLKAAVTSGGDTASKDFPVTVKALTPAAPLLQEDFSNPSSYDVDFTVPSTRPVGDVTQKSYFRFIGNSEEATAAIENEALNFKIAEKAPGAGVSGQEKYVYTYFDNTRTTGKLVVKYRYKLNQTFLGDDPAKENVNFWLMRDDDKKISKVTDTGNVQVIRLAVNKTQFYALPQRGGTSVMKQLNAEEQETWHDVTLELDMDRNKYTCYFDGAVLKDSKGSLAKDMNFYTNGHPVNKLIFGESSRSIDLLLDDIEVYSDEDAVYGGMLSAGAALDSQMAGQPEIVTGTLDLPEMISGKTVTWYSDTPELIDASGNVTAAPGVSGTAGLTAVIALDSSNKMIKRYFCTVSGPGTPTDILAGINIEGLLGAGDTPDAVTTDFVLPKLIDGTEINWTCGETNTMYIDMHHSAAEAKAYVIGCPADTKITLTASVKDGDSIVQREFPLLQKAKEAAAYKINESFTDVAEGRLPEGQNSAGIKNWQRGKLDVQLEDDPNFSDPATLNKVGATTDPDDATNRVLLDQKLSDDRYTFWHINWDMAAPEDVNQETVLKFRFKTGARSAQNWWPSDDQSSGGRNTSARFRAGLDNSEDRIVVNYIGGDKNNRFFAPISGPLTEWHDYVLVVNTITGTFDFYLDGVKVGNNVGSKWVGSTFKHMMMGHEDSKHTIWFDDIKVFNTETAPFMYAFDEKLKEMDFTSVSGALDLPKTITIGESAANVTWFSSHPEVIAADGTFHAPAKDTVVTLTAIVETQNGYRAVRSYKANAEATVPEFSVQEITADGTITVTYANPNHENTVLYVALYEKEGENLRYVQSSISDAGTGELSKEITIANGAGKSYVLKAFAWRADTMQPVCVHSFIQGTIPAIS